MPSLISTLQKAHPNLSLIKHFYSVTPKQLIVNHAKMQNFFHVYATRLRMSALHLLARPLFSPHIFTRTPDS